MWRDPRCESKSFSYLTGQLQLGYRRRTSARFGWPIGCRPYTLCYANVTTTSLPLLLPCRVVQLVVLVNSCSCPTRIFQRDKNMPCDSRSGSAPLLVSASDMDIAGLAVSVAGLFNNAIECFEVVQLGRTFERDLQTSQLKLDNARLKLSRWGKSLGLDEENVRDLPSLRRELFEPVTDLGIAEGLLQQIKKLFEDAETLSKEYMTRAESQSSDSLAVCDLQTDLNPKIVKLHEKLRQLVIGRQNRSGIIRKTQWALYKEKQFQGLLGDVTDLVDGLVQLFPATTPIQRRLCDIEVSEIGDEGLSILKDIAAAQDKMLEQAMPKESEVTFTHHTVLSGQYTISGTGAINNSGTNNSGTLSGEYTVSGTGAINNLGTNNSGTLSGEYTVSGMGVINNSGTNNSDSGTMYSLTWGRVIPN